MANGSQVAEATDRAGQSSQGNQSDRPVADLALRALNPDGSVRDAQAFEQLLRAGRD